MGYVAAPQVAKGFPTAGPLEAERELSSEPLHVTVVGRRDDAAARALFLAALALPANYKMTEFVDGREGHPRTGLRIRRLTGPRVCLQRDQVFATDIYGGDDA